MKGYSWNLYFTSASVWSLLFGLLIGSGSLEAYEFHLLNRAGANVSAVLKFTDGTTNTFTVQSSAPDLHWDFDKQFTNVAITGGGSLALPSASASKYQDAVWVLQAAPVSATTTIFSLRSSWRMAFWSGAGIGGGIGACLVMIRVVRMTRSVIGSS